MFKKLNGTGKRLPITTFQKIKEIPTSESELEKSQNINSAYEVN